MNVLLVQEPEALIKRAQSARRDLFLVVALLAIGGGALGFYANTIGKSPSSYALRAGQPVPQVAIGDRVSVSGSLRLDQIAIYRSDAPFFARAFAAAPLATAQGTPIAFLAEVQQDKPGSSQSANIEGFVAARGASGPLVPLFRNAGISIIDEPLVLMRSPERVRAPFEQTSRVILIVAALLFLVSLAESYWLATLRRQFPSPKEVTAS